MKVKDRAKQRGRGRQQTRQSTVRVQLSHRQERAGQGAKARQRQGARGKEPRVKVGAVGQAGERLATPAGPRCLKELNGHDINQGF